MALDPIVKALLDQMAAQGNPPLSEQTPQAAREATEAMVAMAFPPEELASVEDRRIPGPGGEIPVRVYRPEATGLLPVIVYLHGGGWVIMSVNTHDGICRLLARESGCIVVSVEYRLAPEHPYPAPLEDAYAALAWCAEHATEIGGDPARLAVAGDSAGGNLAAATALLARDRGGPALRAQALLFPALDSRMDSESYRKNGEGYMLTADSMRWFWGHYLGESGEGSDPYASPPFETDLAGLPAAYVATAEYDPLRDEGAAYARELEAAGVPTRYVDHPGLVHDFILLGAVVPQARGAVADVAAAMREALG